MYAVKPYINLVDKKNIFQIMPPKFQFNKGTTKSLVHEKIQKSNF